MKGGFQARSRLETTLDEIGMEAQIAASESSAEQMRRGLAEIGRLTCEAKRFAQYITGANPPFAGMATA